MYHVQFITGTNAQADHLAERIRIMREPASERHDLTFGWSVSDTEEMTEEQIRALMVEHGIDYPPDIPIVFGDYSISDPGWNDAFWHWSDRPNEHLFVWMQPRWWLSANWDLFPGDPYGNDEMLKDWLARFLTIEDIAREFNITNRRARAIATNRHEQHGIGWQVPGTNQWLFRPEELEQLKPNKKYRKKES